jgi:RimJ/RimL family protein N-acetyltransferase
MRPPENIYTARLRLRPPVNEDAEAIFHNYAQDGEVTRYLTWRPHKNILETAEYLNRCISGWADEAEYTWVVVRKDDQRLIGMIAIRIEGHKANLGYVSVRSEWGKGYITEAAQAVAAWAMAQAGMYRVWAVCDVENRASARVLEKVGMKREGVLRRWIMHPNVSDEPRDCYCYALIK